MTMVKPGRINRLVISLIPLIVVAALLFPNSFSASQVPAQEGYQFYLPLLSITPRDVYHDYLNSLGGSDNLFRLSGQLVFLGRGHRLVILDVSVPNQPMLLTTVHLPAPPQFLVVRDGYGYLALGDAGLGVLDLRQPAQAYLLYRLPLAGFGRHVLLSDQAAFVSSDQALYVLDISQPASPRLLSSFPMYAEHAQIHNSLLLVTQFDRFSFYDIHDLGALVEVGHLETQQLSLLAVTANFIYVKSWMCGRLGCSYWIDIIDISDPSQPDWAGSYTTADTPSQMVIEGDTAYFIDGGYLIVARIQADGGLEKLGEYSMESGSATLWLVQDKIYASGYSSIEVIDVSNPAEVKQTGIYISPTYAFPFSQIGLPYIFSRASLIDGGREAVSLLAFDVSNPQQPALVSDTPYSSLNIQPVIKTNNVYLDGKRMYVTSHTGEYSAMFPVESIRIYDLQQPVFPVEVGEYLPGIPGQGMGVWFEGYYNSVQIRDAIGYIITMGNNLEIVDLSNPTTPLVLSTFFTTAKTVCLDGDYAYLVSSAYGGLNDYLHFLTLDISDPHQPTLLSDYLISTSPDIYDSAFDVSEGIAYFGFPGVLRLVDVRDPANPSEISVFPVDSEYAPALVQVEGDLAVIVVGDKVEIIDVSTPLAPALLAEMVVSAWTTSIQILDLYVLLTSMTGAYILDISQPAQPRVIVHYPGNATSIATQAGYPVYLARYLEGLEIFEFYPADWSGE
jgi:hypothetical protein